MLPKPYYQSDRATLYHGDCLAILPELVAGSVDAVVTDPPFGMDFRSNFRTVPHESIAGDADVGRLNAACRIPVRHSRYVFLRWDNLGDIPKPKSLITWVKNNWSMGDLDHEHARQTECIAFYPGPDHGWVGGRPTDVLQYPRSGNELHPTEKGIGLMRHVVTWTPEDCLVLDPFTGSGTTAVACIQTGRRFIGIELEEKYCEIAARRIREAEEVGAMFREPKPQQAEMFGAAP